jgi:hypothetical protein
MRDRDPEGSAGAPPPRSAEEALDRARRHGLTALAEGVAAMRALVDATSLATTGMPGNAHALLADLLRWIDAAGARARSEAGLPSALWVDTVADALDDEIERWETRARHDPEARAVLRAFLGVREILWEFGLRQRTAAAAEAPAAQRPERAAPATARAPRSARRTATRLQRVPIEG